MSTLKIPEALLRDKYAYNPLTGRLYSLARRHYISGRECCYSHQLDLHIAGTITRTSYGRAVYAWYHGHWPLKCTFKDGNPRNTRVSNLSSR